MAITPLREVRRVRDGHRVRERMGTHRDAHRACDRASSRIVMVIGQNDADAPAASWQTGASMGQVISMLGLMFTDDIGHDVALDALFLLPCSHSKGRRRQSIDIAKARSCSLVQ
jgi:hypothetical protein